MEFIQSPGESPWKMLAGFTLLSPSLTPALLCFGFILRFLPLGVRWLPEVAIFYHRLSLIPAGKALLSQRRGEFQILKMLWN